MAPLSGSTGTDTDITERKSAEIRLEETRHELARVSRVTTLAQFAAVVAHETSQPLNTILLNARACLRWLGARRLRSISCATTLQDIADAAKQANEVMIRNRGMFSRRSVEKQVMDMNGIVRDVVALARTRLHRSRVDLALNLDDDLPAIRGDRVELQQVLLNLLLNAIEAVETANPPSREIRVTTRRSADALVQISVRDTGIGLRGIDTKSLFMAFLHDKTVGNRGRALDLPIHRRRPWRASVGGRRGRTGRDVHVHDTNCRAGRAQKGQSAARHIHSLNAAGIEASDVSDRRRSWQAGQQPDQSRD